jgi:hypothetical protein
MPENSLVNIVIDLRSTISDFTGATQAMVNMDYDLVEIVVNLSNLMLRQYNPSVVNDFVFSYQNYGKDDATPNRDGMILSTAISVMANDLQNLLSAMMIYDDHGYSRYQFDRLQNELLVLRPTHKVSPYI